MKKKTFWTSLSCSSIDFKSLQECNFLSLHHVCSRLRFTSSCIITSDMLWGAWSTHAQDPILSWKTRCALWPLASPVSTHKRQVLLHLAFVCILIGAESCIVCLWLLCRKAVCCDWLAVALRDGRLFEAVPQSRGGKVVRYNSACLCLKLFWSLQAVGWDICCFQMQSVGLLRFCLVHGCCIALPCSTCRLFLKELFYVALTHPRAQQLPARSQTPDGAQRFHKKAGFVPHQCSNAVGRKVSACRHCHWQLRWSAKYSHSNRNCSWGSKVIQTTLGDSLLCFTSTLSSHCWPTMGNRNFRTFLVIIIRQR